MSNFHWISLMISCEGQMSKPSEIFAYKKLPGTYIILVILRSGWPIFWQTLSTYFLNVDDLGNFEFHPKWKLLPNVGIPFLEIQMILLSHLTLSECEFFRHNKTTNFCSQSEISYGVFTYCFRPVFWNNTRSKCDIISGLHCIYLLLRIIYFRW